MPQTNWKEIVLASVVVISLLGLLGLAVIDEEARPVFQKVAELTLAAYVGYIFPK
ncbi:MAG: hypothetical protein SAK29_08800 [Scytonema sp. PMC 1069.18]|nr:hypothetical protein [Scytonema sp. PMC 1069.18]MEC4884583.1 hypothetical protein [Scytonema sp. PMC 1070.18]